MEAACPPERLFPFVADLGRYPDWLDIVAKAVPEAAGPDGDAAPPAWRVDLRGRMGPFSRSKRLRMARTRFTEPELVSFERAEHDGREHSHWMLRAEVEPAPAGSRLTFHLHYSGTLLGGVVERLLRDEIERAKHRLTLLVTEQK
jgi:hypothetical protein